MGIKPRDNRTEITEMNFTVAQVRDRYSASSLGAGGSDDALQAKYYARPLSFRIARLFIKLGISPNKTTVMALVADIAGCICIGFGLYSTVILGAVLLNIGHVLDYVDGTIAKVTGTVTDFGRYFDRTCDEIVEVVIPVSIGVGLYVSGCSFLGMPSLAYLILGFIYSLLHTLSTLSTLHTKLVYGVSPVRYYSPSGISIWRVVYSIGVNMKSSAVIVLLVLAFIPNGLPVFLLGFTILTICEFAFVLATAIRKGVEQCE